MSHINLIRIILFLSEQSKISYCVSLTYEVPLSGIWAERSVAICTLLGDVTQTLIIAIHLLETVFPLIPLCSPHYLQ